MIEHATQPKDDGLGGLAVSVYVFDRPIAGVG